MSGRALRVVGVLLGVVALGVAVVQLRDATMSTHTAQDPRSQLELVVEAEVHGSETGQSLAEYTRAKILLCRTEVAYSDPVVELDHLGDGVFRTVLQPALDDTNRTQFRGCLHDWNVDHLRLEVVSMTEVAG